MSIPALPSYGRTTRSALYGFLIGLPLFALYEGLAVLLNTSLRNGAEVWLVNLASAFPLPFELNVWALKAAALGALALLLLFDRRRPPVRGDYLAGALAESVLYSLALGGVVIALLRAFPLTLAQGGGVLSQLTLSFGAGLYEELLFRVLLFGGLAWLLKLWTKRAVLSLALAALVSAVLFAAAHHVGAFGEPFRVYPFAYRTVAGLLFTGLYLARGFGITALSHALYDVWVVLGRA